MRPNYEMPIFDVVFTKESCGLNYRSISKNFSTHLRAAFSGNGHSLHVCDMIGHDAAKVAVHVLDSSNASPPLLSAK